MRFLNFDPKVRVLCNAEKTVCHWQTGPGLILLQILLPIIITMIAPDNFQTVFDINKVAKVVR